MSKVQGNLLITGGARALSDPVQDDTPSFPPVAQDGSWMTTGADPGAGMNEHSLLSRPAAPQYRRSMFRR